MSFCNFLPQPQMTLKSILCFSFSDIFNQMFLYEMVSNNLCGQKERMTKREETNRKIKEGQYNHKSFFFLIFGVNITTQHCDNGTEGPPRLEGSWW